MPYEVQTALIAAVSGLAAGATGSVVAPWVNWGIDKRRSRMQRRRELVDSWREGLSEWAQHPPNSGTPDFLLLSWFQTLIPHLSESATVLLRERKVVIQPKISFPGVSKESRYIVTVREEIDRIEEMWKLV
jgi:hypothetical protein